MTKKAVLLICNLTVVVIFGLGINTNVNPVSTAAVVVISSPKNDGTVPVPLDIPFPTIEPAFLLERITVYPLCVLPLGEVVGESVT